MGFATTASKPSILRRGMLGIGNRAFPMPVPEVSACDALDLALQSPGSAWIDTMDLVLHPQASKQVVVLLLDLPSATPDYCLSPPDVNSYDLDTPYQTEVVCDNRKCGRRIQIRFGASLIGRKGEVLCPVCGAKSLTCLDIGNVFSEPFPQLNEWSPRSDLPLLPLLNAGPECVPPISGQLFTGLQPSEPFAANVPPFQPAVVANLTDWLGGLIRAPEIERIPLLSDKPRRAGKNYNRTKAQPIQGDLFEQTRADEKCVHGLRKQWCSVCSRKATAQKPNVASQVDPFDLILPLLQPPLEENFESTIAFPKPLFDFQRDGVKFLVEHERALLADEMGLGKSIQTISALRVLLRNGKVRSGLILCPKSVLTDWERKLWEWAPELRVSKVHGARDQRELAWKTPAHVYLTTYETLRQDLAGSVDPGTNGRDTARRHFDVAVLDEIQKIKNPGAHISKAARLVEARIRWGLSGTPLENRTEELIAIFAYIKPGLLRYEDAERPAVLKEAIRPYFLRRRKADALKDLPEKVKEEAWVELSPAQRSSYDRAETEGVVALNEKGQTVTVQHVLALITKLKQICNMDPASGESCKLDYLLEQLGTIRDQGDKALVFSQYPEKTLKSLEPELKGLEPAIYHGGLSESKRDSIINAFQTEESPKVLLMSVKAGGLGITLTRANYVFHYDLWWNPSVAAQAEDRAHRIGQDKAVFVTSIFTVGTIEERIYDVLRRKRELFSRVVDDLTDTDMASALTEEELFGLFGLRKNGSSVKPPRNRTFIPELMDHFSPEQFEELVKNIYENMGFNAKLTPRSRDHGVDVHAKRAGASGTEYLAIQCKHYPKGVVGVEHCRALYGILHSEQSFTKAVLVTSGRFSESCREFARGKRIELIDRGHLVRLVDQFGG